MENEVQDILASKLNDFKDVVQSFSELLTIENEALETSNLEVVSRLYEQKSKTVTVYRNMVAYFIQNQEKLSEISLEEKEYLRNISQKLDKLIHQNDMLLKTKMQANKIVMDSIVSIAKVTNNANATSYGSKGKYSPLDNNSNALTINRTL
ncbi:MAG: hypothetical protein IJX20_00155 [Alphaproteobacteria bacterium]|nr:hypothetical protein [Alphaproteobacteria bacterium]